MLSPHHLSVVVTSWGSRGPFPPLGLGDQPTLLLAVNAMGPFQLDDRPEEPKAL